MIDQDTKRAIERLRLSAEAFGYSLEHLTDDEIMDGIQRLAREAQRAGISAHFMAMGFAKVGRLFSNLLRRT